MSIYLKWLIYSLIILVSVGSFVIGMLWLITGGLTSKHIWLIIIATILLSPRFEVITSQSGKSLQMKGLPLMIFHALNNWRKRQVNK